MIILERPNYPPYVCISCGNSTNKKWFVSLQLPLDTYFNPVNDGNVFYCNECWESLATVVAKAAQRFLIGKDPWESTDLVVPTYENEAQLLEEVNFGSRGDNPGITEHSRTTERSDPAPEPNNTESVPPDNNDETEPVLEFRNFFGDGGDTSGTGPDSVPTGGNMTPEDPEVPPETPPEGDESGN